MMSKSKEVFMRLLALVCLLAGSLLAQDSTRDWINRGVQEFKAGHYSEASAAFQKAVGSDPASATARLYLASSWMQQFIPGADSAENLAFADGAKREFLKVLDIDPANRVAMGSLASLNLNEKNWDQAEEWYRKLVAVDPGNAQGWYSLGFIAWSHWYPAYGAARVSLGMKPADPGPLPPGAVKEDLRMKYGQVIENGLQALRQALLIDPRYDDAMAYMNLLIRERADLRDAPADYQRDIAEADEWVGKALETKRQKAAQRAQPASILGGPVGVSQSMVTSAAPPLPPPPPPPPGAPPQRIRVAGNVAQASRIRSVLPVYPASAKVSGIQGVVRLAVIIGKDGSVTQVALLDGPAALAQAAIDSVRKWAYRPTLLNGEPVEVETTVDINFTLNR
jgi:TonB family protein